jgi:hypothetical protein
MEPARFRRLGDGTLRVAQRVELPRRDHPMLLGSQFRQRSMPNL